MDTKYYDLSKTLSKQRLFNFVVGARGCGKTYAAKMQVIKNFLRKGEQFVYVRRYETELPSAEMINFFDDVMQEFPDHNFKSGKGLFKIDNQVAGWYIALSKAPMLKSIPFPHVTLIIYDEFIIETGVYQYLPNEVRAFLDCYSTISRDRDVTVLFLSNALTMSNPYFIYFEIKFDENQKVFLTEFISAEIYYNIEFENHIKSTKFGKLIAGTSYGNYAMKNKFLLDTDTFIEKMPQACNYICTFLINGFECGYYINSDCNRWYLSTKIDKSCKRKFTLNLSEHTEDSILAAKNNLYIAHMINQFCQGRLRFETLHIKNMTTPTIKKMI